MDAALRVRDLTVVRDDRRVLDRLSLSVHHGRSLAVIGPSGSGKSTLLDAMAGLLRPESGSIIFDGFDVSLASRAAIADWRLRSVGIVFQFAELLSELTLLENVQLPLLLGGVPARSAVASAESALGSLDIAHKKLAFPSTVSGGERQRAAVARAIVHRPKLLLADEPTGALDPELARGATEVLLHAAEEVDAVLVLVTHNPAVAEHTDEVFALRSELAVGER